MIYKNATSWRKFRILDLGFPEPLSVPGKPVHPTPPAPPCEGGEHASDAPHQPPSSILHLLSSIRDLLSSSPQLPAPAIAGRFSLLSTSIPTWPADSTCVSRVTSFRLITARPGSDADVICRSAARICGVVSTTGG